MDLKEALRTLEIAPGEDRAALRRAYLRAVKAHPPERDPEGFQRVRSAYELLQRVAPQRLAGEPVEVRAKVEASVVEPAPPLQVDPLEAFRTRLYETTSDAERAQIGQEAAATLGTAAAYELWIEAIDSCDELGHIDDDEAVTRIAREALSRGHAEFLEVLRSRVPAALTAEELAAWADSDAGRARFVGVAAELVRRGKAAEGAHHLQVGYERLLRDPLAPRPFHWFTVDILLRLLEQAELARAAQLLEVFVAATDPEDRGPPAHFEATRELIAVAPELDAALVSDIASALREGSPEKADFSVMIAVNTSKKRARAQGKVLRKRAPVLAGFYAQKLERPERLGGSFREPWFKPGFGAMWAFMILARFVFSHACDSRPEPELPPGIVLPAGDSSP